MLTNIVKLRYMEPPVFLDVQQIVTQYTRQASASISAANASGTLVGPSAGVSGYWADSPTITYSLMSGDKFIKSLLEPASPLSLLQLVQSGWPIDGVFAVAVRCINGIYANSGAEKARHAGDPNFYKLLKLLRELQVRNHFNIRVEIGKGAEEELFVFRNRLPDPEAQEIAKKVRELLGLNPDATEFHIAFGSLNRNDTEIAFLTRSMLDMLTETATGVDIPAAHLAENRVTKPLLGNTEGEINIQRIVHVHSSEHKPDPKDIYAAIQYRGYWFWIDDRDINSKRGMSFLMTLFTLASPGASIAPPVLTISKP